MSLASIPASHGIAIYDHTLSLFHAVFKILISDGFRNVRSGKKNDSLASSADCLF
jgi:hypothetical protein